MPEGTSLAAGTGGGILVIGVERLIYEHLITSGGNPGAVQALPAVKAVNYGVAALEAIVGAAGAAGRGPLRHRPDGAAALVGVGLGSMVATYLWQV